VERTLIKCKLKKRYKFCFSFFFFHFTKLRNLIIHHFLHSWFHFLHQSLYLIVDFILSNSWFSFFNMGTGFVLTKEVMPIIIAIWGAARIFWFSTTTTIHWRTKFERITDTLSSIISSVFCSLWSWLNVSLYFRVFER